MPKAKQSLNDLLYDIKRIEEHRETLSEKKIRKIYKQLMKELNAFIGDEYVKHADEQGVLVYTSLKDRSRQARFLEEVVAKVDSITPELKKEIMGLVEATYTNCYKGMEKAVAAASNTEELAAAMGGSLVKPEVLKQSLNNNISKLTLPNVLEKHRQEIVYNIKQELTIGLLNGDRYEKMARRLTDKLDISYKKATNIVRTESHRNIESGLFDCAENIAQSVDGSGMVFVCTWRTMQDERVRPNVVRKTKKGWKHYKSKNKANHVKMEGVTIRVGDKFKLEEGVYTKYPSQSGKARHDCNCRCFLEYDVMTEEEFANVNANAKTTVAKATITTEKGVANSNESDIIKSIDVDDYNVVTYGKNISEDVSKTIFNTMKQCETDGNFIISEIKAISIEKTEHGTPVLQIEPLQNGLLQLNLNTDKLAGKTLKEIDEMFINTKGTVVNSLGEALIHESGHAKSVFGKDVDEIKAFYDELSNIHIKGISEIAYSDGAECLAEIEVLRSRGVEISSEAMAFYEKYMGRKYK